MSEENWQWIVMSLILSVLPLVVFGMAVAAMSLRLPSPNPVLVLMAILLYVMSILFGVVICPIATWKCPCWLSFGSLFLLGIDILLATLFALL